MLGLRRINPVVTLEIEGDVAVITVDAPPLNVLSAAVRQGIAAALLEIEADDRLAAVVLICEGKGFFAGADISEFGGPIAAPDLPTLIDRIESFDKPIVAAMHGTALGGGFELAMACHARIAAVSSRMGLPEVKLGLIPGCGGGQRLTRLAGAMTALEMVTSGLPMDAGALQAAGVLDQTVAEQDLRHAAIHHAAGLAKQPPRRTRDIELSDTDPALFDDFRATHAQRFRGQDAPEAAIESIENAISLPFDEAVALDRAAFVRLEAGPQSAALRHVFFAERAARKIPGLPAETPTYPIERVGIVGAGTMGGGIAMCFANAGLDVVIIDTNPASLKRGIETIRSNYQRSVSRGRMSESLLVERMARIAPSPDLAMLADCDLIIEAVYEDMTVKKSVFAAIDAVARAGAILATNTSFLDVNEIAAVTSRPDHVLGLHFFSPANVMRLLEIVRGAKTAPAVLATVMALAVRIGKVGVCVGVCHGFVGNRMLAKRQEAAGRLILEGALPWDVDRVLFAFGMPMGPFAMADLAGLDLGWSQDRSSGSTIEELLCESGRFGQKTGKGYYDYDGNRKPMPSRLVEELLAGLSSRAGIIRRAVTDAEILERCLGPMIAEGRRIEADGIARGSDIDTVWVNGYGWPAWTGGPMYWAEASRT